jgi:hypothetical protein
MPGWLILPVARASLKKRRTCCSSSEISERRTLMATRVPTSRCSASQTSPMPPLPSSETIVKFPMVSPITGIRRYHARNHANPRALARRGRVHRLQTFPLSWRVAKPKFLAGAVIAIVGAFLAIRPLIVADALNLPHATNTQWINLRASWGGTLMGIGLFVAWLPGWKPWWRPVVGLLMWAMVGVGAARLLGFALDGDPDSRQAVWIFAEVAIVIVCALALRKK